MLILRVIYFILGAITVAGTILSAIRTFVLPRAASARLTTIVFVTMRHLFNLRMRFADSYIERDRILAFYVPFSLLLLPIVWLSLALLGYTGMFWALGIEPWDAALKLSGSSLLTLGFSNTNGVATTILAFTEAIVGLILIAILIAYLPTMYTAFSRRELAVTLLEVRAGSPPSPVELIERTHRIGGLHWLTDLWKTWEIWFAEVEESHTSLAALPFFRSPQPGKSWVTAAGTILDAAALTRSALDLPPDPQADLCIRAGYLCLRRISDFFGIAYDPRPKPDTPISITRAEFDAVCEHLAASGVPLKADRDQAWRDYAGWRVNYDAVLLGLSDLMMAPKAMWSSDRAPKRPLPSIFRRMP